MQSTLEREFETRLLQLSDLPQPESEYSFHPERKWRFDFAYPDKRLAIEIEGGTWSHGRHSRPLGFSADCEKYNEATVLGWRVLRFTSDMLRTNPFDCIALVVQCYGDDE